MKKIATWLLAGALGVGTSGRVLATESEAAHEHHTVTMGDLPRAVRDTLHREAKGGKVEELRKETRRDGTVVYEAEIVKSGKGTDIEVNADGMVVDRGKAHDERSETEAK